MGGILSGTMSFVRLWEGNFRFERELRMVEENGILGSFCHIVYKNCIRLESVESKTFVRVRIFRNVEV